MQKVNFYAFYSLGAALHPLQTQVVIKGHVKPLLPERVMQLFKASEEFRAFWVAWNGRLTTSKLPGLKLLAKLEECDDKFWEFEKEKGTNEQDWNQVSRLVVHFVTIFAAEVETFNSYLVDRKGIYSTDLLINSGLDAFSEQVQGAMPDVAKQDFVEAARCLAFSVPTATGFHVLRSLETSVIAYHKALTGNDLPDKDRNWGAYVRALRAASAPNRLSALLDQIRDNHRNPLMHPEHFLSADEAIMLFDIAKSAIVAFVQETIALTPVPKP